MQASFHNLLVVLFIWVCTFLAVQLLLRSLYCHFYIARRASRSPSDADCRWAARRLLESLNKGARISASESSAIAQSVLSLMLIKGSDIEVAAAAVIAGADVCYVEPASGQSLLHIASGKPECSLQGVAFLLLLGAPVDAFDADGNTPLSCATVHGRAATTDLLLAAGACPLSVYNTTSLQALGGRTVSTATLAVAVIFANEGVVLSLLRGLTALYQDCRRRRADGLPPLIVRWRGDGGAELREVTCESICSEVTAAFTHAAQVRDVCLPAGWSCGSVFPIFAPPATARTATAGAAASCVRCLLPALTPPPPLVPTFAWWPGCCPRRRRSRTRASSPSCTLGSSSTGKTSPTTASSTCAAFCLPRVTIPPLPACVRLPCAARLRRRPARRAVVLHRFFTE